MNENITLTKKEYNDTLDSFLKNKSFSTIKLLKLKKEPLYNLYDLLTFHPKTINYIPISIIKKHKDWILLNLLNLGTINIFDDEVQKLIFKNANNILDYNTIKIIIKNSSNPLGLFNANSNIFPLSYTLQLPHISKIQSIYLYKKIKSNKISLSKIDKFSSRELLLILGRNAFSNYLKQNLKNFTEDAIYHYHSMIDINILLKYKKFKPRAYFNFLFKSRKDKKYLELFLKNTNISHFYILSFFSKDSVVYYLQHNKHISIDTLSKLAKMKELKYIDWLEVYTHHSNKLKEENIVEIISKTKNTKLKQDIISAFLTKSKYSLDNIKELSKEPLLIEAIKKEILQRFENIAKI